MNCRIFISYSSKDRPLVSPVVQLLRAALHGLTADKENYWELVFQDVDSIRAGESWNRRIMLAIMAVEKVFVFWCTHSEESKEVRYEYESALFHKKEVTPVLLDNTPLPEGLKEIHGVDLRPLNLHETSRTYYSMTGDVKSAETILKEFSNVLGVDVETLVSNSSRNGPYFRKVALDKESLNFGERLKITKFKGPTKL